MSLAGITSPAVVSRRARPMRASALVMPAPDHMPDEGHGSPARGIMIAMAASGFIWAGIAALIF